MKDVWGEIIETAVLIAMLTLAIVAVSVIAQGKGVDILGNGIFESGDSAFKFPVHMDTNSLDQLSQKLSGAEIL